MFFFQPGIVTEEKRQVPKMLQKILRYDVQVTKKFVELALKTSPLRSLRNHAKLLEVILLCSLFYIQGKVLETVMYSCSHVVLI